MKTSLKIGVFCSSRSDIEQDIFVQTTRLAHGMGERGYALVYGGARVGLMGHLADEALGRGVHVHGVIPHCLNTIEVAHTGLQDLVKVEDLFERKRWMMDLSDHFVVLPGGIGTLDELLEVLTWKDLGQWQGEIIIFNHRGFWDSFLELLLDLSEKNVLGESTLRQYKVCDAVEGIFEIIDQVKKA